MPQLQVDPPPPLLFAALLISSPSLSFPSLPFSSSPSPTSPPPPPAIQGLSVVPVESSEGTLLLAFGGYNGRYNNEVSATVHNDNNKARELERA